MKNEVSYTWGSTPSIGGKIAWLLRDKKKMYMLCSTEICIFKFTVQNSNVACLARILLGISLGHAHVWMHWEKIYYKTMQY